MNGSFKIVKGNAHKMQFCILFVFIFFASSAVFGQSSVLENSSNEVSLNQSGNVYEAPVKTSTSELNPNMNFILWFMGTKEDVSKNMVIDSFYSKKSILTSGREPNHLLMKTLLKRAVNNKIC